MPPSAILTAARAGDRAAFHDLVGPHQPGLLAYCYRLSGSLQDAEDSVQDALLRAWRGLGGFEERASFKSWIYRIATRTALDRLRTAKKRALPPAVQPASAPDRPAGPPITDPVWLDPFPDQLLPDPGPSADAVIARRQSLSFAFLQALQQLPPRQRAALLLKDVVGMTSAEVAEELETSAAAVNSMLQRARDRLGAAPPPTAPSPDEAELIGGYVRAFEESDASALVDLLRSDAVLSMPPIPSWYQGPEDIAQFLQLGVFAGFPAGSLRGVATAANGLPAVAMFARGPDGWALVGVHTVRVEGDRIAEVVAFMDPASLRHFAVEPPSDR